jgi:replication factor A1
MKQISLKAKVMRIAEPMVVFTKFGNNASVANALIADETGTIKLSLWNEQIDSLEVGDVIQVANARVSTFRNERQLRIGRNGTVKVVVGTSSE